MSISKQVHRLTLIVTAFLLVVGYPLTAMAQAPEATDPAAATQPAAPEKTYTYNPNTGRWDSNEWYYDPVAKQYKPVPQPAPTIVAPTTETTPSTDPVVESHNDATDSTKVDTNVTVDNDIDADAQSGDASVLKNLVGGNATTGDAASTATIINSVNSVIAAGDNDKVATFTYDVMGDVKGDIMLYPMMLKTMLEAQAGQSPAETISAKQNNTITNDVNLSALSGDATVGSNTKGGNATTGSATTVANVVNILNSMIAANQSFVGTVNIYGSLEGDILIAPDFIPQMIANNKELAVGSVSKTDIETKNQDTIINNIALAAQSGGAAVTGNTKGGDATTGAADSNIVIFNLSGHDIVASNSLLVFVNVLGKWVGVIVDAPAGATSAMIGDNVTKNDIVPDLTVEADTTNTITNNITLVARSGDAVVSNNTEGGNATSGDAKAMANVANITNTQVGISNWFGILFINVFDSWYGSFGVNTAYGNDPENSSPETQSSGQPPGVFVFVAQAAGLTQAKASKVTVVDTRDVEEGGKAVLAAATGPSKPSGPVAPVANMLSDALDYRLLITAGSILLIGLSILGLRQLLRGKTAGEVADL